ncbi:MAG: SWIM zinc finger family protein [Planctomycetes bacterium]|nr:SWIM zinc finger family protein [Planctomycetota bacterium]
MSRRSGWDDFWGYARSRPKKAAPKSGLVVGRIGATWWGARWIDALQHISSGYSNRLSRGRSYARAGRVHDLELERGCARARVTGSRVYDVEIRVCALSDAEWKRTIRALAARATFAAQLLDGAMPREIDEAFAAAKVSLFPSGSADLTTTCSCPDWANPCKHVAALHYVLGEALDRDPFFLFELRGRGKAEVLDALREARAPAEMRQRRTRARGSASSQLASESDSVSHGAVDIDSVVLDATGTAADYELPRTRLSAMSFRFDAPASPALVLRQLGQPPSWPADESIFDALGPLYAAAADLARALASAGGADSASTPLTSRHADRRGADA